MHTNALALLGQQAHAFASAYTALVEALMHEGVPQQQAREDARWSATVVALSVREGDECPLCGGQQ